MPFELGDDLTQSHLGTIFNADLLILNIPPGRKNFNPERFTSRLEQLIRYAKINGIKQLLFISTTAVYGESTRIVYEYSELEPVTESAKAHEYIEHRVREVFADDGTILRLAGLIGDDRHPARFLSGREHIENGQQVVNLVHLTDVIRSIEHIILTQSFGYTLHLSATEHPTRAEYYTFSALEMGLAAPLFASPPASGETGKQINCELTLGQLNLQLAYPSPFDML